ncbi:MAG TPA: DUF4337 family protein [Puia sp.]|jgi:hypothetical protein|nr:DUF4337 family protein [Puia sp.]
MEEIEIPTEHLHEEIQEKAEEKRERWTLYLALSTALMAVLAAVAGLLAGHHANEALVERVKASDAWNYYQSKSLKQEIAVNTEMILRALAAERPGASAAENPDIARYEKEKEEIRKEAETDERLSEAHLAKHVPLSRAVTAFQIAIAISAIAILTRRKILWWTGLALTAAGIVFLLVGSLN